jgi:Fur family transcriptional regulator, ferric uptake regulator
MTASVSAPPLDFERPETVLNALRSRGLRVSTARRLIIETLFEAAAPVSAEQIAVGADGRARLDIASVYRNLETLEAIGVVRHCHAGHGPGRYALAGAGEREYLACERCGALAEVDPRELDAVRDEVRRRFGYSARFTHFPIVGMCPNCVRGDER